MRLCLNLNTNIKILVGSTHILISTNEVITDMILIKLQDFHLKRFINASGS